MENIAQQIEALEAKRSGHLKNASEANQADPMGRALAKASVKRAEEIEAEVDALNAPAPTMQELAQHAAATPTLQELAQHAEVGAVLTAANGTEHTVTKRRLIERTGMLRVSVENPSGLESTYGYPATTHPAEKDDTMNVTDTATVDTLNTKLHDIVNAALEAGFTVFAPKPRDRRPAGFVFACLDTEGSFVTVGVPTHNWDDVQLSAPIKPNKVSGSSVLVDYDGTPAGAVEAMRKVCQSPMVMPRFIRNAVEVPNHGNKDMTTWPGGGADAFAQIVAA